MRGQLTRNGNAEMFPSYNLASLSHLELWRIPSSSRYPYCQCKLGDPHCLPSKSTPGAGETCVSSGRLTVLLGDPCDDICALDLAVCILLIREYGKKRAPCFPSEGSLLSVAPLNITLLRAFYQSAQQ